jgi:peptidoglycan/xylan/chitin deacetylase (PgdA/CDA1 family)
VRDKRKRLAALLDRVGLTEALLHLGPRGRLPWLTILTYHRVLPVDAARANPFDDTVVDASPESFERQVIELKRYFQPVGVAELCAFARGAPCPPNAVAVTFDDGYRDNHDHVLPILRRHGVKAIFFISTSYIGKRRVFWWDRVWYALKHARTPTVELTYPTPQRLEVGAHLRHGIWSALRIVKSHYDLNHRRFLNELTHAAGLEWSDQIEQGFADQLVMTWDHVRALAAAGMDVESHTRWHGVLQTLPPDRLMDELEGAQSDLEREVGRRARALAYPTGLRIDGAVGAAVRRAGYEIGLSNATGTNRRFTTVDPFDLHRVPVDGDLPPSFFRTMMALPIFSHTQ